MAVGDLSCWTSQRHRSFRGLFRLHNGSQSSGKSSAQAYVERVSRLIREADLLVPVHVRPLNCENHAPVARALWPSGPSTDLIEEERSVQVFVRDNNVDQALKVLKKRMQRLVRLSTTECTPAIRSIPLSALKVSVCPNMATLNGLSR